MSDVQTARWGKLLQAAMNLKQRLTLGQALPDVMPIYDLEHRSAEMEIQAGMDLCRGYGLFPAVAAQYSGGILVNPANSGKVVIVDKIFLVNGTSASTTFYMALGGLGTVVPTPPSYVDWRRGQSGRPTARIHNLTGAASIAGVAFGLHSINANFEERVIDGPVVLTPGGTLWVQQGTLNLAFSISFQWRERLLDQSETLL